MTEKFDVIGIGSGLGGLTAGAILARLQGKRVLILEKHYVAGGQTHEFHRHKYSWDVGVHYVGGVGPGEETRMLFDLITGKQVNWNPMPDVYDRFVYPDMTIDVHKDPWVYAENLIALFPDEEVAIRQYIRDIRGASDWYVSNFLKKSANMLLRLPFIWKACGKGKLARMTTRDYMDRSFKDEKLKSVLTSQWGDYGLTPDKCAFGLHSLVVWGYCSGSGAFFPEGGGRVIAQSVEKVIAATGGRIQVDTEVTEILIRDGKAYGVKARQSNGWEGEYHANTIISNVGAELTFRDLIPVQYCKTERQELAGFETGNAMVTLYIGLKESPGKFGIQGENYWISDSFQQRDVTKITDELLAGNAQYGFISFPSMKNRQAHGHTAEICVAVDPARFRDWSGRPSDYYLAKDRMISALLELAERQFPGFYKIVDYVELSTPLTIEHYTSRPRGEMYGIPGTPARFKLKSLSPRTPIKNLYLSGSDVCSLGIAGALYGGVGAAARAMGPFGFRRVMIGAKTANKTLAPKYERIGHMMAGKVIGKIFKNDSVIELGIWTDQKVNFSAGQHVDLQVTENDRRAYSVLSVVDEVVTLVIDVAPGGPGSQYIKALAVGDNVAFTAPKGNFLLNNNAAPVCFISTGTGMVPLMAMLEEYLQTTVSKVAPKFIFGTGKQANNYMPDYLSMHMAKIDTTYCLSRESKTETGIFNGRITHYLNSEECNGFSSLGTEFYICGNPNMVLDVQRILREKGAKQVFVELY